MMSSPRGFTLIELLLVISIIGLLSTVILAGLSQARGKARDAAVKRQLIEMRTLMAREFTDTGSYANLKANGSAKGPGATCSAGPGTSQLKGAYAADFKRACDALIQGMGPSCATSAVCLQFNQPTGTANVQKFSMYAYLPETSRTLGDRFLCVGSNGRTSVSADPFPTTAAGCPNDPEL